MATDASEYRFRELENRMASLARRVENLDEHGSRRVGVLESELKHLSVAVDDLSDKVEALQRTVIGAAITVAISALGFAITVALTIGQ